MTQHFVNTTTPTTAPAVCLVKNGCKNWPHMPPHCGCPA
jgi:hypothetical protein